MPGADVPGRHETFTRTVGPRLAEAPQPVDIHGLEDGKHLRVPRFDDRT